MSSEQNRCDVCKYKGLVIYPARYTVLPQAMTTPGLGPFSGERVTDITLTQSQYALRALRKGFVYLFYEKGKYGKNYWEAYSVAYDGTLRQEIDADTAQEQTNPKTCSRNGHSELRTRYLVIEQPGKCGTVWLAFSEHKWTPKTRKQYEAETERKKRMQPIEPGQGGTSDHTAELTDGNLSTLIDYAPKIERNKHGKPIDCPDEPSGQISLGEDGSYSNKQLQQCITRYPWPVYGQTSDELKQQRQQVLQQAQQSMGSNNESKPMMMALWDATGVTHELNGFRNDPASWFERYNNERALQVTAMHDIAQAHAVLKAQARQRNKRELARRQRYAPLANMDVPLTTQRQNALAGVSSAERKQQIGAYYDDLEWMQDHHAPYALERYVQNWAKDSIAGDPNAEHPYIGDTRDRLMKAVHDKVEEREKRFGLRLEKAEAQWEDCRELLDTDALETFRQNYGKLEDAVYDAQEDRSADIVAWLEDQLWLDALEDYDGTEEQDRVAFEEVIGETIFGLSSTESGQAEIKKLAKNTTATDQASLLWRTIARNHPAAREELTKALAQAKQQQETPLTPQNVDMVEGALGDMSILIGLYGGTIAHAQLHAGNITKIDKVMMTAGDAMLREFMLDAVADGIGEKILQNLFLARAHIDEAGRRALLEAQAKYDLPNRQAIREGAANAHGLQTMETVAAEAIGGKELRQAYEQIKVTEEGQHHVRAARVAVVVAIIEAINISKLLTHLDDEHAKTQLLASATGLAAALTQIMATPAYAVIKESSLAAKWRLVGGALGSVGAFVGAAFSYSKIRGAFRHGALGAGILYIGEMVGNAFIGTTVIFSAISAASPLAERVTSRFALKLVATGITQFSARALALVGSRIVGWALGWEAMVGITALQFLAGFLMPDPLRVWFARCAFGGGKREGWFITHDGTLYSNAKSQQKGFEKAIQG